MKAKLEARLVAIDKEFDNLNAKVNELKENRKVIDTQLSQIQTRQLQLQGSYSEAKNLLKEFEVKPVVKK